MPPNQKDLYDVVSSGGGLRPLLSFIMFSFFLSLQHYLTLLIKIMGLKKK